jgi:hypothetical protein
VASPKSKLTEGLVYPCVNLSYGTEVSFRNYDTLKLSTSYKWLWGLSATKKARPIVVSDSGLIAGRTTPRGMNPSVLTTYPITKAKNHFRVQILDLGKWIGIGICDTQFILNNSKMLGSQSRGINAGYFYQNGGLNKLQMFGEKAIENVKPLAPKDFIDIVTDFAANRIYFYHNERLQGFIAPIKVSLRDGLLFPCANLSGRVEYCNSNTSVGCQLMLCDESVPILEKNMKWKKLLAELPSTFKECRITFLASWRWTTGQGVSISPDCLIASCRLTNSLRTSTACTPLTKTCNFFLVEILQLGESVRTFFINSYKTLDSHWHFRQR